MYRVEILYIHCVGCLRSATIRRRLQRVVIDRQTLRSTVRRRSYSSAIALLLLFRRSQHHDTRYTHIHHSLTSVQQMQHERQCESRPSASWSYKINDVSLNECASLQIFSRFRRHVILYAVLWTADSGISFSRNLVNENSILFLCCHSPLITPSTRTTTCATTAHDNNSSSTRNKIQYTLFLY